MHRGLGFCFSLFISFILVTAAMTDVTLPAPGPNPHVIAENAWFVPADPYEVVVFRLDVGPEAVRASAALLSDAERQRANRFAFDRDRRRFIVARAGLRKLLSVRLSVRPESVELTYGPHGKPTVSRRCADADLRFNVSHSEDVAVYAFAPGREIGVDVEAVRVLPDADDIAACFFSRCENEAYRALDPRDRPLGFFNCWTRKEAFLNYTAENHLLYSPTLEGRRVSHQANPICSDVGYLRSAGAPFP
jgi:4'-phosphopantetheinyl transferase